MKVQLIRRRERADGSHSGLCERHLAKSGADLPKSMIRYGRRSRTLTESWMRCGTPHTFRDERRRRHSGEERLREHTDQLYGAILSYEGKPGDYQIAYVEALQAGVQGDVAKEFEQLVTKDLPTLNDALKAKGQQPVDQPPAKIAISEDRLRQRWCRQP